MSEPGVVKKNRKLTSLLVNEKKKVRDLEEKANRFIEMLSKATKIPTNVLKQMYDEI